VVLGGVMDGECSENVEWGIRVWSAVIVENLA
jgi:hypothetical protein